MSQEFDHGQDSTDNKTPASPAVSASVPTFAVRRVCTKTVASGILKCFINDFYGRTHFWRTVFYETSYPAKLKFIPKNCPRKLVHPSAWATTKQELFTCPDLNLRFRPFVATLAVSLSAKLTARRTI